MGRKWAKTAKKAGRGLIMWFDWNIKILARLFVNMVGGVSRLPYMMPEDCQIEPVDAKRESNSEFKVDTPTKISLFHGMAASEPDVVDIHSQKVNHL